MLRCSGLALFCIQGSRVKQGLPLIGLLIIQAFARNDLIYITQFFFNVSIIAINHIPAFALQVKITHLCFPEGVEKLPLH